MGKDHQLDNNFLGNENSSLGIVILLSISRHLVIPETQLTFGLGGWDYLLKKLLGNYLG